MTNAGRPAAAAASTPQAHQRKQVEHAAAAASGPFDAGHATPGDQNGAAQSGEPVGRKRKWRKGEQAQAAEPVAIATAAVQRTGNVTQPAPVEQPFKDTTAQPPRRKKSKNRFKPDPPAEPALQAPEPTAAANGHIQPETPESEGATAGTTDAAASPAAVHPLSKRQKKRAKLRQDSQQPKAQDNEQQQLKQQGQRQQRQQQQEQGQAVVDVAPLQGRASSGSRLLDKMRAKLQGGRFRWLNEQLYTSSGDAAFQLMQVRSEPCECP